MAFEAATILQLVLLIAWTVLSDTPINQKNGLFTEIIRSRAVLDEIASTVFLVFAPGLFDVLQAAAPPTVQYFKTPPTDTFKRWAVYSVVLEKPYCRPRIYIGSGTESHQGVSQRISSYTRGVQLPQCVQKALDEGYTIVHKGLLCRISIPTAAFQPKPRLLFILLEATLAHVFWAMRTVKNDYVMAHTCLWDRNTLEHDGCCSHRCLSEIVSSDFQLSAEQLEAQATHKKRKRADDDSSSHHEQMATNRDECHAAQALKAANRKAQNPDKVLKIARDNAARHVAEMTYYCKLCKFSFPKKSELTKHNASAMHLRKAEDLATKPHQCNACNVAFDQVGTLNRHLKTPCHLKMAALSSSQLD
jgi:hypothetical protein